MGTYACDPGTWEFEKEDHKFRVNLGYMYSENQPWKTNPKRGVPFYNSVLYSITVLYYTSQLLAAEVNDEELILSK